MSRSKNGQAARASRVPVTVISGYLGAGKTTLLSRILREPQRRRYAILINEFSELGIDAELIVQTDEEVIELSNGCLCCTIRGDLVRAFMALERRRETFDGILIETSGVADPASIAQTVLLEDVHRFDGLALDALITVVDALNIEQQLLHSPTAANQVALADVMLLNKVDLVGAASLAHLRGRLETMNATAEIISCRQCDVPICTLLESRSAYALDVPVNLRRWPQPVPHGNRWRQDPITSVTMRSVRPLDADDFMAWITELLNTTRDDLLRAKGFVSFVDEPRKFVFHGVMGVMDGDAQLPWPVDEPRESKMVFIGRNLDRAAIQRAFDACLR